MMVAPAPHHHVTQITRSFFFFFFFLLLFAWKTSSSGIIPVKVGVVVDLDLWAGRLGWSCLNFSLSDFYASYPNYTTRLHLHLRQPGPDVVTAAAAAMELINEVEVEAIIGPGNSMQAEFMIQLGSKSRVPVITFSATSSALRNPYFFRATNNDSAQAHPITALVDYSGWREVVIIYVDNAFGAGILPYLTDALQQVNTRVAHRTPIPPSASHSYIALELSKLMAMQTRVFILHMTHDIGVRVFAQAKRIGMMREGYAWITTDAMTNLWSQISPSDLDCMQGVLALKSHVPQSANLARLSARWKRKFHQDYPNYSNIAIHDAELDLFGARAYDSIFALALAIEKVGARFTNLKPVQSDHNSTVDLQYYNSLRVSETGPELIQALSSIRFPGIAGDFRFVSGQFQASAYQIININGSGYNTVGFWTPEHGLTITTNIIWPGHSFDKPKAWELPTNGERLKIGVPVKLGFREFVYKNDSTGKQAGFSIDMFKAAIAALPYAVPHDFFPFENSNGQMAGTYNDLIDQVFLGKYDAVVGDMTIEANRSSFVDFTLPYTESGITMVVPIQDRMHKDPWVFLKPLTWRLWLTSACSFVFIGFVVWVLEHRLNHHFRGPPSYQIGTSLWFAFSTMLLAHQERLVSNLSRFVVIIWCFLVLILTQSYTASLTSLLTVRQLQPTVTDVHQLSKNGAYVGYLNGSFVEGILKGWKFDGSKLRIYNSADELDALFSKGSIAAAVDEKPYVQIFLAKYCNKYTTVELPFKTNGFGFVFPKGSPLVPEISMAILNVTQTDKFKEIEANCIKKRRACPDHNSSETSNSLGLGSFSGPFLIAGVVATSALALSAGTFLFQHRNEWSKLDPQTPMWTRVLYIARMFDQKDWTSHVSEKTQTPDIASGNNTCVCGGEVAFEVSPSSSYPGNLSSSPSPDMNSVPVTPMDQGTPSPNLSAPASPNHSIITHPTHSDGL